MDQRLLQQSKVFKDDAKGRLESVQIVQCGETTISSDISKRQVTILQKRSISQLETPPSVSIPLNCWRSTQTCVRIGAIWK
jgi:hypothetical protein